MENEIFRLCAVAVICAVVGAVLGKAVGSVGVALRLGGLALAFGIVAVLMGEAVRGVSGLALDGVNKYLSVMLRGLGIVTVCRICSDICRGCGESVVADVVESGGKLTLVLVAMPVVEELVSMAVDMLDKIS